MTTVKESKGKTNYNLNCINNALVLLKLLSNSEEGMSLTNLSLAAKVSKNKTFRLLTNFEQNGILEKDARGRYFLGKSTYATARKIVAKGVTADKVQAVLEKLAGQFEEAVYFARNSAGQATLIDMVDGSRKVMTRSLIGTVLPPQDPQREKPQAIYPYQADGVTIYPGTIDPEVTAVSIEMADSSGKVFGSLVVLAPTFRMPQERIRTEVIPALHETIRQMPQLAGACNRRNKSAPAVLQLVPKRDEVYSGCSGM